MRPFTLPGTIAIALALILVGCSDDKPRSGDHVWKSKTDTIKRAEEVQKTIDDAARQQLQAIERATEK